MTVEVVLAAISWLLIAFAPINLYFLWHGWVLNRSVEPRSPVLRALLWVEFSVTVLALYFAIVAYRFLFDIEPALPFGGILLGLVILFMLAAPAVVYSQMRRFVGEEQERMDGHNDVRGDKDAENDVGQ